MEPNQSKSAAPASRSIINYRLTCGFSASVFPRSCTEKGQSGVLGGIPADRPGGHRRAETGFSGVPGCSRKNAPDLIRRGVSRAGRSNTNAFPTLRLVAVSGKFMQLLKVFSLWSCLACRSRTRRADAQTALRRAGRGGRAQSPSSHGWCRRPIRTSRRTRCCFVPPGEGPFPLALIAHASTQNVLRRAQMPQPEYAALAAWLVARGFAVLVPERPGHGAHRRQISRGPGRLRRRQLFPRRLCDRGFDQGGARLSARGRRFIRRTARS